MKPKNATHGWYSQMVCHSNETGSIRPFLIVSKLDNNIRSVGSTRGKIKGSQTTDHWGENRIFMRKQQIRNIKIVISQKEMKSTQSGTYNVDTLQQTCWSGFERTCDLNCDITWSAKEGELGGCSQDWIDIGRAPLGRAGGLLLRITTGWLLGLAELPGRRGKVIAWNRERGLTRSRTPQGNRSYM